jgi:hypothetical protein
MAAELFRGRSQLMLHLSLFTQQFSLFSNKLEKRINSTIKALKEIYALKGA